MRGKSREPMSPRSIEVTAALAHSRPLVDVDLSLTSFLPLATHQSHHPLDHEASWLLQ